ncbi:nectin-1-like isoform X1 [Carassius carassius]|uniref:nectin-1-like isoform X1 n=1 Tax=Carassius carassius TaxID=217509 RepID=UPI0028689A81|nr:nectin-1-like isoform X1 [Carassius carassius]
MLLSVTPLHGLILFSSVFVQIAGVKVIGHDTAVVYGENATLLCQLTETHENADVTRIIWKKKTKENAEEKTFFSIRPGPKTEHSNGLGDRVQFIGNFTEKNGSIQLLRMGLLDDGIYTCIFNLFAVGTYETDINVTVFARPSNNVRGEVPVAGFTEATLVSCFASNAKPAAEVIWRLGDLENSLKTNTNYTMNSDGTVTVVSYLLGVPFKHLNKKNVQCVVKHNTLRDELVLNYTINIHYPPYSVVIIPDSPTNIKEFQCKVDSNPEPTNYNWTRVNKSDPYYEGKKLPVLNLTPDFNGLYICHASNQYGSSIGSLYVNVHMETNAICWSLFCVFIAAFLVAVFIFVFIWKHKQEWIQVVQRSNDERDQADVECQSR